MPRIPRGVAGSAGPRYAGGVNDTHQGLEIGSLFAGCRVERLLGRGTGGSVYLATRAGGEAVVLKLLAPGLARDPQARARFLREWEALSKLRPHPNLMRVHEVHDGERPYLVAEHVPGQALDVLLRQGPLAPRRAAEITRDMALGLGAVHALGLLHRDVKPANAIVAAEGPAKVVDFGLAKDLFRTGLTHPGQILGTVLYMAPEVWEEEEEEPDARADVFSLGVTLYELLVGRPPFLGDDPSEVADAVLEGDYRLLAEAAPHVPQELDFVVRQMLATEPGERYGRMEEVAKDLGAVLEGRMARVPALSDGEGRRWPLLPGAWFTLGSAETSQIVLPGTGPSHAELRREAEGFVVRDLGSAGGTFLEGVAVEPGAARRLVEGAQLRVGLHELTFHSGAPAREGGASYRTDVERVQASLELCQALARARDPRAALYLLERLAPDPSEAERARVSLEPSLGPAATGAILGRRDPSHGLGAPGAISELLGEITGARVEGPLGWLSWWRQVRLSAPTQVGPGLGPRAVLQSSNGFALPLGDAGVVLVGRDERCALRLPPPAPRLRATLLRLHRRWILIAEGEPFSLGGVPTRAGFLDPGQVACLGEVQLRLEVSPGAERSLDPTTFQALWSLAHPSVLAFALGLLSSSPGSSLGSKGLGGPSSGAVQESQEALRGQAQQLLTQAFGPGDPAAWGALLARGVLAGGEPLPAQVFPEPGRAS